MLFLFTDDQRFDTIGALNHPDIKTPNIDRLVKRGVSFTNAYIMGGCSGAVCMPSRAMLMTGRHLFHLDGNGGSIPGAHTMMLELFRQRGYRNGNWKLIRYDVKGKRHTQLFDLSNDPWETTNLASRRQYEDTVRSLTDSMWSLMAQTGDPVDSAWEDRGS